MLRITALVVLGLGATVATVDSPPPFHPHFPKKIEVELPGKITMTVSHITVTFDKEGEAKLEAGRGWHLGNAHLEVSSDVRIGGQAVKAGNYSLKGRKKADGSWELVLDKPSRFSSRMSDESVALETMFQQDAPLREHLSLDIQPSGDKSNTSVFLEVHFDTRLARCLVELPAPKDGAGK